VSLIREINKRVDAAIGRLSRSIVRRALLASGVDATYSAQLEGDAGDVKNRHEFWQHFGFTSRPPAGGEAAMVAFGAGEGAVVVAENDRAHRPETLASGDAMLYAKKDGSDQASVHAKAAGNVDLNAPKTDATVNVGGDAEFLLLGETVKANMNTFAEAVEAITPGNEAANAIALGVIKDAASALDTAIDSWLAEKGKVT